MACDRNISSTALLTNYGVANLMQPGGSWGIKIKEYDYTNVISVVKFDTPMTLAHTEKSGLVALLDLADADGSQLVNFYCLSSNLRHPLRHE